MADEKITITISHELKERLVCVKNESNTSISAICEKAIVNYLENKELEKWKKGFKLASQDEEYMELCNELGNDDGGLYKYHSNWNLVIFTSIALNNHQNS